MTIQQETADLHLVVGQTLALMDAIVMSVDAQTTALGHTDVDKCFNSNWFIASELSSRMHHALEYNRTALRQTLKRLEAFGPVSSTPPSPLVLTPYGILEQVTGFCVYRDPTATQAIPMSAATVLANNRSTVDEMQKPVDIPTYYDGTRFRSFFGDAVFIQVEATLRATSSTVVPTNLTVWIDDGSGVRVGEQVIPLAAGYNVDEAISYSTPVFTSHSFATNGAQVRVLADGPAAISDPTFSIVRLHRNA